MHIKDWNMKESFSPFAQFPLCTMTSKFKFRITIGFDFSWVLLSSQEKLKTMLGASKVYSQVVSATNSGCGKRNN